MDEVFTWFDFATMFIGSIGLSVILLTLFSLLHGTEFFKRLHASRMYNGDDVDCPIKPMSNPFAWLHPVWTATEDELIKVAGLDAAVFIRMFTFSIQLFCILNILCLPILLPLNATKTGIAIVQNGNETMTVEESVDLLAASNYSKNDGRLWGIFAMLYVISGVTCFMIWRNYKHIWVLRHKFLASRSRALHADEYTLLLTDIPDLPSLKGENSTVELVQTWSGKSWKVRKDYLRHFFTFLRRATLGLVKTPTKALRSDMATAKSEQVDAYFRRFYPDNYLTNQGVRASRQAQRAYKRWKAAVRNLKRSKWKFEIVQEENRSKADPLPDNKLVPFKRTGFCGCWGPKVESIPYWEEQVKKCSRNLEMQQAKSIQRRSTGSAFICFNSRRVASVALQTPHSIKGHRWRLQRAPEPRDVIWRNVELRTWERTLRSHLGFGLTILLTIFFLFPVTATAGLTSLTRLQKIWPSLGRFVKNKWFNGIVSSFLASFTLRILLWIVPPLLLLLARLEGYTSQSEAERMAVVKHFYLLLFNVFLGYAITDTLWQSLEAIIKNPSQVLTILGISVPKTSAFFISYVIISGVLFFIELLRFPIPFFRYLFVRLKVGKDIADREKRWNLGRISYHVFVPYQNLVITFGLVFAVLAPLILPFVLVYSIVGNIVWRHQIMYCYGQPYQTGGLMWPHFVNHVFVALLIAQLTALGLLTLKGGFIQAGWITPLPILTIYIWLTVNAQYRSTFRVLPLELACEVDEKNENEGMVPTAEKLAGQYLPKCLREFTNPDLSTQDDDSPRVSCGSEDDESSSGDGESPTKSRFVHEGKQSCVLAVEDERKKEKNKFSSVWCCIKLREVEKDTGEGDAGTCEELSEEGEEQEIEDSWHSVVDVSLHNGFDRNTESSYSSTIRQRDTTSNTSTINQASPPDSLSIRQVDSSDYSTFRQINGSDSLIIRQSDTPDSSDKQTEVFDSFDRHKIR